MGSNVGGHLVGWLVPYPDIGDYEEPNDGTTNHSSYSQASPRPGLPVPQDPLSTLEPVISGAQDGDLVVHVLRGGAPGRATDSVQLGYRYDSEAVTAKRGWSACNGLTGWDVAVWTTTATTDHFDAVTHPDSQQVLLAYGDSGLAGSTKFARWDPTTHTWSGLTSLAGAAGDTASALLVLPTGRVLLCGYGAGLWRSDDFGSSWTQHASDTVGTLHRMRMCEVDGEILLIGHSVGGSQLSQYASSDGGASFTLVGTIATFGTKLSALALPDGKIVIIYRRNSDGLPCCRIIGSPWDPISGATAIEIDSAAVDHLTATVDPDGTLWVYGNATAAAQTMNCWLSLTGGATWGEFDFGVSLVSTSALDHLIPTAAVSTQGQVMILHKWAASTDNHDPSIGGLLVGGWSNAAYGPQSGFATILKRVGFAHPTLTPSVMLPIERPDNAGWAATGAAGSATLVNGRVQITTAAGQCYFSWVPGTELTELVVAGLQVISGGMVTQRDIGLTVAVANGTSEYRIDLRFVTTGFRIFDPHAAAGVGATLADVVYDTTAEMDVMVYVTGTAGGAFVLYKRPYEAAWNLGWQGSLTNDATPAAAGTVDFGAIAAVSTGSCDWRFVAQLPTGVSGYPGGVGRWVGTEPVPLHCEVSSGGVVGRISAIGGLGALSEAYDVPARYDYPATAAFPQKSPSPASRWRTTSKAEQRRAFEIEESRLLGSEHNGIIAVGCNFRTAYLQTELAGWTTIATLDLATGFAGINYTLSTSVLVGRTGGVGPARYLKEGELEGGYAVLTTGGGASQVARRIWWNTAGYWTGLTTTRRAHIYLQDVTGSEDTSSVCDLVWPAGVAVNYASSIDVRQRYRILIPANQVTPDDYYEAGILVPAALRAPGAPPDWGYAEEFQPNVSERTTRYGTTFVVQKGPPIRSLTFGWSVNGVDLSRLQASATDADYVGIVGQNPLSAVEDVPWLLAGLQRFVRSGEIPVVALKALPAADGTVNDPDLILYGQLSSSVGLDHVQGDEGENEHVRPVSITIRGIP